MKYVSKVALIFLQQKGSFQVILLLIFCVQVNEQAKTPLKLDNYLFCRRFAFLKKYISTKYFYNIQRFAFTFLLDVLVPVVTKFGRCAGY